MENIYKQIPNNDSFTNGGSNTVMVFNLQFLSTLYYLLFIYVAYKTLDLLWLKNRSTREYSTRRKYWKAIMILADSVTFFFF